MIRHPYDVVAARYCHNHPGPPPLTLTAFPTCCAHYPGGPDECSVVIVRARSRAGFFPIRSAFPGLATGRRPHCRFRGLLKLHAYYGLSDCSPTLRGLCREVSARPVSSTDRSPATESNHQLFGWVLPPLVISPFGAHARPPALPDSGLLQRMSELRRPIENRPAGCNPAPQAGGTGYQRVRRSTSSRRPGFFGRRPVRLVRGLMEIGELHARGHQRDKSH